MDFLLINGDLQSNFIVFLRVFWIFEITRPFYTDTMTLESYFYQKIVKILSPFQIYMFFEVKNLKSCIPLIQTIGFFNYYSAIWKLKLSHTWINFKFKKAKSIFTQPNIKAENVDFIVFKFTQKNCQRITLHILPPSPIKWIRKHLINSFLFFLCLYKIKQ